jgi:hypothetical protein
MNYYIGTLMSSFAYSPEELLTVARTSHTPVIIVEGYDDISIYENISKNIGIDVLVFSSENLYKISNRIYSKLINLNWSYIKPVDFNPFQKKSIKSDKNGKEGCEGVLAAIKEIQLLTGNSNYEKYIMGIIDKDINDYRNTLTNNLKGLFTLKYYSIESYFITHEHLCKLLKLLTKTEEKLITEELKLEIFNDTLNDLYKLYYISLEALKNACEINYDAICGFNGDTARDILFNDVKYKKIIDKKNKLDNFAITKIITPNLLNLLKICKGKWILDYYVYLLKSRINELKSKCELSHITQCQYCQQNKYTKCLYKMTSYNEELIKNFIMKQSDITTINDIKNKIINLKNTSL